MNLLDCGYRSEESGIDRKGRTTFQCSHPKMAKDAPTITVRGETNCVECVWAMWNAEHLIANYVQEKPKRVTPEAYSLRVTTCEGCERRAGNYCQEAGGCGLTAKLRIRAFDCPLKKFGS